LGFETNNGIIWRGGSGGVISNIFSQNLSGTLISLEGTQSEKIVDIFIDTVIASAIGDFSLGIGIKDWVAGLYISKVSLLMFAYGMYILGSPPGHIFCNQVILDSCSGDAYQIESGNIIRFSQCWGASSNRGFNILGGSNIWLDECTVINNKRQGVYVQTSGGVHIRNSQIARNSQAQQGAYHGIHVPPSISGVTVEGCRLGTPEAGLEKQGYGAFFDSGSSSYIATGNDTRGNIVGGIFNGGSNSVVANNL
jgi:parallel beta-helix repeat protein